MIKMNNIKTKILTLCILGFSTLSACDGASTKFTPPNKEKPASGTAEKIAPPDTAMNVLKYSDAMAKSWSPDAFLVGINGVLISKDGKSQEALNNSQWIITYFSPKKSAPSNVYTITFSGKGVATWLENTQNYGVNNNISNFSVDSYKAIEAATKAGLPESAAYTLELGKNAKGMNWVTAIKSGPQGHELRKIDALSGALVN